MAGAWGGEAALGVLGAFAILNWQSFLPILPVTVLDAHGDGGADGLAVAHARENVGLIFLNALAAAAAEA